MLSPAGFVYNRGARSPRRGSRATLSAIELRRAAPISTATKTGQERDRCASRLLTPWSINIGYVLDRLAELNISVPCGKFTAKLDMSRAGIFGHSFGGAQAKQFCSEDSRCKAAIDLDSAPHGHVIQTGIKRPFMFLLSDHSHESDPQTQQIKADIQSIYERIPASERLYVWIRGSNHFTFSDDGAVLKSHLLRGVLRALGSWESMETAKLRRRGIACAPFSTPISRNLQVHRRKCHPDSIQK